MTDTRPILYWLRRDLRLADHPGLTAAAASGRPVIAVFIHDQTVSELGAAPAFRLGLGLERFGATLGEIGSRLVLRRGPALEVLQALVAETGAGAVWWTRDYTPQAITRDSAVKAALKQAGIEARSFGGALLFEPWTVETGTGGYYKVYTPFWRAVSQREVAVPDAAPSRLRAPASWPGSDALSDWRLDAPMRRGAAVVAAHQAPGEAAALERLDRFVETGIGGYAKCRDLPAGEGTSTLSDALSLGEIGPRTLWHRATEAARQGAAGAETWMKQLVWRDFAYHLMYHTPHLLSDNWRPGWEAFPWSTERSDPGFVAWTRGRTGIPLVDAAMREMYVTGRMHNRARMIAASYLTKHLMIHWKLGMDWFADCLTDWDPAANAMGWQWVAGCGPDAAPYFRIFNPETQAQKFDADGRYRKRWIAEGQTHPPETALAYFDAVPRNWGLRPDAAYPAPVVTLNMGRKRALAAYSDAFQREADGKLA
ncbi:deoxyribodipyrimidine photo-lyase [Ruegeria pomeroyi]|nr:deoxyribodipyrimidine photo-lyase [Ruegeria pomeroyi]